MGNSSSNKSSFEQHNWRKIQQKRDRTILYNDITMKSVQRHEAVLDCDEGQAISMCKWRASLPQDCCVVDLYEYGIKKTGMCNSQSDLYVITQRIHLLQQIGTISKPQAFLILRDVASGLRVLFRKFGYFNPRPNIIGINSQGRAKVWTNQNFAKLQPQKDTIPIQQSQLGIVNNLIRILESKTYNDHSLPIDYPRNLDLSSVVGYINKVFTELKGFEVDRVYVDRTQFNKKYNQLRQRNEKQQLSRMIASQQQRKLLQIQILHENLRVQQQQLAKREQQLKLQAQAQEQQLRQQQLQRQYQFQYQQHKQQQIQNMLAVQQAQQVQLALQQTQAQQLQPVQQIPMSMPMQVQQQIYPSRMYVHANNQIITDNSQGKILRGTASTNRSDLYGHSGYTNQAQGQANSYGNLLLVPQHQATNNNTGNNNNNNTGNNTFRQSSVGKSIPYQQQQQQTTPQAQVVTQIQARNSLPPQIPTQHQPNTINMNMNMNARPPLPPKPQQQPQQYQQQYQAQQQTQQQTQQYQQVRPSSGERRPRSGENDNIRKQIQMVDSMILMQEDQMSDQQNKRYVESRILTYKM